MKAIILAGGKGTRLRPYTTNFPKPLMPIGDKPILEAVIQSLKEEDIVDILITTGHLSQLIRLFFGDGRKFGVNIQYSIEDMPLGTGGPIKLLKDKLDDDFIIMNGDVLTDMSYLKIIEYHKENQNVATVGIAERNVHIDFGVVELDATNQFSLWKEKPTIEYLVSMGIYVFSVEALKYLPKEDTFGLPDFIESLSRNNKKIMGYIHKGYWLDIGRPEDYEQACKDFERM